jgi:hypothetical protein
MNILSVLALPAAIALSVAASPCSAQDKANKDATAKASSGAVTAPKGGKAVTKSSTALEGTNTKALTEGAGAKTTPTTGRSIPTTERTYESCHGKDSDA